MLFDGHPPAGAFARTEDGGVDVRFTGDREADDEILDEVRASRRASRITVVTDDLELARRVEQMGAQSVRVAKFFTDEDEPRDEKPAPSGFTAADFGLPETVDTDAAPDPSPARILRLRGGARRRGIPPR